MEARVTVNKIKWLKNDKDVILEKLRLESLASKHVIGSHNKNRLVKALATGRRLDLVDRTLLSSRIHKDHASRLSKRYISRWEKLQTKAIADWKKVKGITNIKKPSDADIAAKHFRFLTIVDSVCPLSSSEAITLVKKLKAEIQTTVTSCSGVWCLGVIEIEIVELDLMRKIKVADKTTETESRKLDVCDVLSKDFSKSLFADETALFLIHSHCLVTANTSAQLETFEAKTRTVKRWKRASRQVEIKKLSESFAGKPKSVERNLIDIAQYITKGGNDWFGGKAYLRYKVGFENYSEDVTDEAMWEAINWRRNKLLQQEHKTDGLTDLLSLTNQQILELAILIDKMMGLNRTRTGYLVSAGR
jgi:hypothetical protein